MKTWSYRVTDSDEVDMPFDIVIEAPTESDALWTLFRTVHGRGCVRTGGEAQDLATAIQVKWATVEAGLPKVPGYRPEAPCPMCHGCEVDYSICGACGGTGRIDPDGP